MFVLCETRLQCCIAASANVNSKKVLNISWTVSETLSALLSHAFVDHNLQDQLMAHMSLAKGTSHILIQFLIMHAKHVTTSASHDDTRANFS